MVTYVIGDIQGCYASLKALLQQIGFQPQSDTIWFTGDLVNRGPQSLEVLRFIVDLPHKVVVLGNHDLHLLAVASGLDPLKNKDTFTDVLEASDREQLLQWLRTQPFFYHDAHFECAMVHAGLIPQWDLSEAKQHAGELSALLCGEQHKEYLSTIYGHQPDTWSPSLTGAERHRFLTNVFTRIRYCTAEGRLNFIHKGVDWPKGYFPWFEAPNRRTAGQKILFGHWASLNGKTGRNDALGLDTGCVWGRKLTAYCLETNRYHRIKCQDAV